MIRLAPGYAPPLVKTPLRRIIVPNPHQPRPIPGNLLNQIGIRLPLPCLHLVFKALETIFPGLGHKRPDLHLPRELRRIVKYEFILDPTGIFIPAALGIGIMP